MTRGGGRHWTQLRSAEICATRTGCPGLAAGRL